MSTEKNTSEKIRLHPRNINRERYDLEALKIAVPELSAHLTINKYGVENFSFEILEETDKPEQQEIYYISLYDSYKNGYNATIGRRWKTENR